MNEKEVIVLFSGGRDSFLTACKLIENGYKIYMVTFENGIGLQGYNAKYAAEKIIKKYGNDKAEFLGVQCIAGFWREFFLPYYNMKPSEIIKEFGELTISQFHCLTCRMSMYIWSIIKAKQMGIKYIAEGARENQGFVVELPIFISKLKNFLKEYNIDLLLPVYKLNSDHKRKDELLIRGFLPKTLEPQCLIGVPLPSGQAPDNEVQGAAINYLEKIIIPRAKRLIEENLKTFIDKSGDIL